MWPLLSAALLLLPSLPLSSAAAWHNFIFHPGGKSATCTAKWIGCYEDCIGGNPGGKAWPTNTRTLPIGVGGCCDAPQVLPAPVLLPAVYLC